MAPACASLNSYLTGEGVRAWLRPSLSVRQAHHRFVFSVPWVCSGASGRLVGGFIGFSFSSSLRSVASLPLVLVSRSRSSLRRVPTGPRFAEAGAPPVVYRAAGWQRRQCPMPDAALHAGYKFAETPGRLETAGRSLFQ